MVEVTPSEALSRMQQGALLVDVREQNEFDEVHAAGATLMPLSQFEDLYHELPADREILLICRSGARSGRATEFLLQNGYSQVMNLKGGTLAWLEADLPSVKAESGKAQP